MRTKRRRGRILFSQSRFYWILEIMFHSDKTSQEGGGDHYNELTSGRPVLHAEGQFVECHFSTSQFVPFRRVGKRQLKEILREAVANDSLKHSCKQKRFKVFQDSLGLWIPRLGFLTPGTGLRNLDSGFQSLVGFSVPWTESWISKAQGSRVHKQQFPGFWKLDSLT